MLLFWLWSEVRTDAFVIHRADASFTALVISKGCVIVDRFHFPQPYGELNVVWGIYNGRPIQPMPSHEIWGFGLVFQAVALDSNTDYRHGIGTMDEISIPVWPFVLWLTASELAKRWKIVRGNRRVLSGLCPQCGYDVRVTPGRCPECGSFPS